MKRFKIAFSIFLLLLLTIGSIRIIISARQRSSLPAPAVTPSLKKEIPLAEGELLTTEDLKTLKGIVVYKPQTKEETQALTKEDVQFLLDEKIVTQEEAKVLLELDRLVPTNN